MSKHIGSGFRFKFCTNSGHFIENVRKVTVQDGGLSGKEL